MIKISENLFHIDTDNTSMLIKITRHKHAELLHYGGKIDAEDSCALMQERSLLLVNSLYPDGDKTYGIDDMAFVYSQNCRGDSRIEALCLSDESGNSFDFQYDSYTLDEQPPFNNYAHSHNWDCALKLRFMDVSNSLVMDLWFLVFERCDVVTRFTAVTNLAGDTVDINAIMSAQFDLPDYGYSLATDRKSVV